MSGPTELQRAADAVGAASRALQQSAEAWNAAGKAESLAEAAHRQRKKEYEHAVSELLRIGGADPGRDFTGDFR